MEPFLNTLKSEWAAITAAPWSFALLTTAAFGLAFAACRWAYQSRHDSTTARINLLEDRLKAKDGQLDEYRERLGLLPASGSKFAKLSHGQLQEHALKFVNSIRAWFAQSDAQTRQVVDQQWNAMTRAKTEEEKRSLWEAHSGTLTNGMYTLMREFEQKYKVDAILLRDELLSRLPATERNIQLERRYDMPVNTFCIRKIADDLERKAKLLR